MKNSLVDLHIHSENSLDGQLSIEEIAQKAKEANLQLIAITDHNYINDYSNIKDINYIKGVELDVSYLGIPFHLLYYYETINDKIVNLIDRYNQQFIMVNRLAIDKFITYFQLDFTYDDLAFLQKNDVIVYEELGEYLFNSEKYQNYEFVLKLSDLPNRAVAFYWEYFSFGKIAYVKEELMDFDEVLSLIKDSNGLAIIAHPLQNFRNNLDLLEQLCLKVDGLELYSSYHRLEDFSYLLQLVDRFHLMITCGSDFHGKNKPNIHLGEFICEFNDDKIMGNITQSLKNKVDN
ncbi:MAG: PHP domain-containing protein [Erysipelotrichaceae bacterium]